MSPHSLHAPLVALLLLGGCASGASERRPAPVAAAAARPMNIHGLENVIGRTAKALEAQFGKPDLDVREEGARKLQFSGPACVLDAYLYSPAAGGEPIVTHLDARQPGGADIDRASCVAALTAGR
jgi:hypothetical protein